MCVFFIRMGEDFGGGEELVCQSAGKGDNYANDGGHS